MRVVPSRPGPRAHFLRLSPLAIAAARLNDGGPVAIALRARAIRGGLVAGVQLRGVRKAYGNLTVADGIDLTIAHGELVCLLGPSGCGKTTTLRLIAGFMAPDAGTIHVGDKQLSGAGDGSAAGKA